ncbi:YbaL family putative K(+) efflux transporter [Zavarzinia compransoris]|uniref:Kef family K(+) transporter n=1 Tax=Zavarzinia compransoris TaxID=1264899 RepID=A0A317E4Y2_9PROT|nr:YbaL family putative K(+) efflux transporter [Zavarzinia compransoris]PWR20055.1 Kef family K(+) transporter [Zavarzinia compransoris]TDP44824.1 Kef-type potassium/proton antiporter (CPA2 family) [Zavarzinia compransoris]
MPHGSPLISTIVIGLGLAFILGALANRLRISPLVGYLLAGVMVGPATPGFVADQDLAAQLAEIGVILLMFGVGLHFSLKELLSVRTIAIPGAVAQIAIATVLGLGLGVALGWPVGSAVVFGLALSCASTVVLLRAMQERRLIETERGRIAVGWLIVEDLVMVLTLVLLPPLAGLLKGDHAGADSVQVLEIIGITLGKVVAFIVLMLVVGRRVIPWLLHTIAHMGSRELFRLCVLAVALGVAYGAAHLFGVSFALGAFFAGMILSESELSQRATQETLPLRDAFAVLFFVSVGMLFDPWKLMDNPASLAGTVFIIVIGKSVAAFAIVRLFGKPAHTALTISASLAQIGEFSFILAALGLSLGLMSEQARDLILAGAILSIMINPLLFGLLDRFKPKPEAAPAVAGAPPAEARPDEAELVPTSLADHAVLVGYGRVGAPIGDALTAAGIPFVAIEERVPRLELLRQQGIEAFNGNAVTGEVLEAANIAGARWLFVAIPESFEAGQIIKRARTRNPGLTIIARAHEDAEIEHLTAQGANAVVNGEREIANGMIDQARLPGPELQPLPA